MRRRQIVAAQTATLVLPWTAAAQTSGTPRRIGVLLAGAASTSDITMEVFLRSLRDLGWVEGRDFVIEVRFGDGDARRLDALAAELAAWKPDVVLAPTSLSALATRRAATNVPVVFSVSIDPIGPGLVDTLARPGRNATGLTTVGAELGAKRLELLRDCAPSLMRAAVLNELTPSLSPQILNIILAAGRQLGIAVAVLNANDEAEIRAAFDWVTRERPGGLFVLESAAFLRFRKLIVTLATAAKIPAVYPSSHYIQEGGLMSYGANYADQHRRAAGYVDKILKGANASDLPVQQPTRFELVINMKAARAMGIRIPERMLLRADQLIQ